jgi:hypothetical protein
MYCLPLPASVIIIDRLGLRLLTPVQIKSNSNVHYPTQYGNTYPERAPAPRPPAPRQSSSQTFCPLTVTQKANHPPASATTPLTFRRRRPHPLLHSTTTGQIRMSPPAHPLHTRKPAANASSGGGGSW